TVASGSGDHDTKHARLKAAFFIVETNQGQLALIASLLDAGELQTFVGGVIPFSQASEAYCGGQTERRGRGKFVIDVMEKAPALTVPSPLPR
ncbi:MAG TPA: hypothetical protein VGD78_05155, partial [Chthoniobacterales bacterium]